MNEIKPDTESKFMIDGKGHHVPINLVKPQHLLEDQTVRKIIEYARPLSAIVCRFKGHTFDDVATFLDILSEQYDAKKGGTKGNVTLTSFDGCLKVMVQVQDTLVFGPELQVAKTLFDECITRWSEGSDEKIHALVDHAFNVDKQGQINREAVFGLRRLEIKDDGWRKAIKALNDSINIQGSKQYIRFYERKVPTDAWQAITIDIAKATAPAAEQKADEASS